MNWRKENIIRKIITKKIHFWYRSAKIQFRSGPSLCKPDLFKDQGHSFLKKPHCKALQG